MYFIDDEVYDGSCSDSDSSVTEGESFQFLHDVEDTIPSSQSMNKYAETDVDEESETESDKEFIDDEVIEWQLADLDSEQKAAQSDNAESEEFNSGDVCEDYHDKNLPGSKKRAYLNSDSSDEESM